MDVRESAIHTAYLTVMGFCSENLQIRGCLHPNPHNKLPLKIQWAAKKKPSLYIFQWFLVSSKIPSIAPINVYNKCDSKYTMRLATRVQVVEFWPIKCGRLCARTRKKGFAVRFCSEWTEDALSLPKVFEHRGPKVSNSIKRYPTPRLMPKVVV
jgi:hypothetical protein